MITSLEDGVDKNSIVSFRKKEWLRLFEIESGLFFEGERKVMNEENYRRYSVLMSVYHKEKPEYLRQAIESIQKQSFPTNDFVLVCDGVLTPELDAVIAAKHPECRPFGKERWSW